MNWVDVLVVLVALVAAVSGAKQGVVVALPAFLGVLGGAIIGIRIAPSVVDMFKNPAAKVAFAVATVVFLVALGETVGVWIGHSIKGRIRSDKLAGADHGLGALVQGAVVFLVAWLIALPLTSVSGLPGLSSAISHSVVLGWVNDHSPAWAAKLPRDLRKLFDTSGLPAIVEPFNKTPEASVKPPEKKLQRSDTVQEAKKSILKIRGDAPSCSRLLEGSGFVVAPHRVMTNAHVVAGTSRVNVQTSGRSYSGTVVHFDPEKDVAIIAVPSLSAPALHFAPVEGETGDNAIVLGYPLDGPYTATAARIRQRITLQGPDIYESHTVGRDVYTVRGKVRSGNSGGPMLNPYGDVLGVVFGASVQDPDTGFTLTSKEVATEVAHASSYSHEVDTEQCTS